MDLAESLRDIVYAKGVPEELVLEAITEVFTKAYQEVFGATEVNINVDIPKNIFEIFIPKSVVKRVRDPRTQINPKQAAEILGLETIPEEMQTVNIPHNPSKDFSPAEIMHISESILYKLREYEKNSLRYEFIKKRGELVSGSIVKIDEEGNIFVDIQKTIARLPLEEQSPLEHYEQGDNIKAVVHSVQTIQNERGRGRRFEVLLSRRSPNLIRELMKIEIPDIADGNIEIKNIARSVGYKTKVMIDTNQTNIDPVALCIGPHGIRIISVIKEIGGEKIDIIRYSSDIKELIRNALTPAKVERVIITDEENKIAYAVVYPDQLPFAFGKQKQNVILVSKLSGYRIQIRTDEEIDEENIQGVEVKGLGGMFGTTLSALSLSEEILQKLHEADIFSVEQLVEVHVQNDYDRISSLSSSEIKEIQEIIEERVNIVGSEESSFNEEASEEEEEAGTPLNHLPGLSESHITALSEANIHSLEQLVELYQDGKLETIDNLSPEDIKLIQNAIVENIEIEE